MWSDPEDEVVLFQETLYDPEFKEQPEEVPQAIYVAPSRSIDRLFTEDFFNRDNKKAIEQCFEIDNFDQLDWFNQQAYCAFYQVGLNPDFLSSLIEKIESYSAHSDVEWKREYHDAMHVITTQATQLAKGHFSLLNNQKLALLLVYVRAIHKYPDEVNIQTHLRKKICDFYRNASLDQTDLKKVYDALAVFSLAISEKRPIDEIIEDTASQSDIEKTTLKKQLLQYKLAQIEDKFKYHSGWNNRVNCFWKIIFCFTYYNPQTKEELKKLRASFFETLKIYIASIPDDKGNDDKIKAYQCYQQSPAVKININAGFWAKWRTNTSDKIDAHIKELKRKPQTM